MKSVSAIRLHISTYVLILLLTSFLLPVHVAWMSPFDRSIRTLTASSASHSPSAVSTLLHSTQKSSGAYIPTNHRQLVTASNTSVIISMYYDSKCASNTQLSSIISLTPGACSSADDFVAFDGPQNMRFMKVYCDAAGPVHVFGYSDSSCTQLVSSSRYPDSHWCESNYRKIACPANLTTPDLPLFPPAGHVVTTICARDMCTTNCAKATYPPNVCLPFREPGVSDTYSRRYLCSSSSNRYSFEQFIDASCNQLISSLTGAVDSCFNYDPSGLMSCPAGVATSILPSFPPAHSVVTSTNCTNAVCRQNCTEAATVMGVCTSINPDFSPLHMAVLSFAYYCTSDGHVALAFFSDSSCSESNAIGAVADQFRTETCLLDGQQYVQQTCSYSPRQPQLPSTIRNTASAFGDNQCDATSIQRTVFLSSNECAFNLKLDCSDESNPVLTQFTSDDCSSGARLPLSLANGQCSHETRLTCASSAASTSHELSHLLSVSLIAVVAFTCIAGLL